MTKSLLKIASFSKVGPIKLKKYRMNGEKKMLKDLLLRLLKNTSEV